MIAEVALDLALAHTSVLFARQPPSDRRGSPCPCSYPCVALASVPFPWHKGNPLTAEVAPCIDSGIPHVNRAPMTAEVAYVPLLCLGLGQGVTYVRRGGLCRRGSLCAYSL